MLRILEAVDYETLSELKKTCDHRKKVLTGLSAELRQVRSRIKERTALLGRLNREYAVMEKKIREGQNRIFYIRDQVSTFDKKAYLMKEELENTQRQLAALTRKKQQVIDNIIRAQEEDRESAKRLRTLEDESRKLTEKIDAKGLVKQKEANAISMALEKTSFAREEIEEKITKLNNAFMESVEERTAVTAGFTQRTADIEGLRKETGHLEEKKEVFVQFQVLQGEYKSLDLEVREAGGEAEKRNKGLEDLKKRLEPLEQQLDHIKETNRRRAEEMEALEEELAEYDKAATKYRAAKDEKEQTLEKNKQGLKEVMALFTEPVRFADAISKMEKKIEAVRGLMP